ncbi:MAG: lactonase family protein [Eubacterium sp.]|nr:lactonase family protein [Eubacterium sp.]
MKREKYVAYVGTYTTESSKGIHIYDLDVNFGRMEERKEVTIHNPSNMMISYNGKLLYSIEDEGVAAYRILPDGDLEFVNDGPTGGMRGSFLTTDKKSRYLFVGGYHDGRVSMVRLNKDGSIGEIADGIFHKRVGIGITDRSFQPHVTCVQVTPDQKYLCAVDGGLNHVKIYEINYRTGKLKLADILRCQLEAVPKMILFSKDGGYAYLMCEKKSCINVYRYENESGQFQLLQTVSTVYDEDVERNVATNIALSEDGAHLFCSNAGSNSMVIYDINPENGELTVNCHSEICGAYPKMIIVMPDGGHFLCVNSDECEIVPFKVNYEKKYFLQHGKPIKVDKPNCMLIHRLQ